MTYTVELGDGPSMFDAVSDGNPERRALAVQMRLDHLAGEMASLLDRLAEQVADLAPQG